jgi:Tol biopolymer transport system component
VRFFSVQFDAQWQNIWTVTPGGAPRQIIRFTDGRVLWPTISYDGRTIAFERDFEVWKLETGSGQASKVAITRRGAASMPVLDHVTLTTGFSDLSLSPDGRKVVFSKRYSDVLLAKILTDPSMLPSVGQFGMPDLNLRQQEVAALVAFINHPRTRP